MTRPCPHCGAPLVGDLDGGPGYPTEEHATEAERLHCVRVQFARAQATESPQVLDDCHTRSTTLTTEQLETIRQALWEMAEQLEQDRGTTDDCCAMLARFLHDPALMDWALTPPTPSSAGETSSP